MPNPRILPRNEVKKFFLMIRVSIRQQLQNDPGLIFKKLFMNSVGRLARHKHSSLLQTLVNYSREEVL
jgi:hypothetical protein